MIGSYYFWLLLTAISIFCPIWFYFKNLKVIKNLHPNVLILGYVSLLIQFAATLVHSSSLHVMSNTTNGINAVFTKKTFILIKDMSEAISGGVKFLAGYITDIVKGQKGILMVGYGSMAIFKVLFAVCTLSYLSGKTILWIPSDMFFGILFIFTHIGDRIFASGRDAAKNKALTIEIKEEDKFIVFALRKYIGSLGSVLGAIITYFVLDNKNILSILPPTFLTSVSKLYFLSVVPVLLATLVLFLKINDKSKIHNDKDATFNTKSFTNYNNLSNEHSISLLQKHQKFIQLGLICLIPVTSYFMPNILEIIVNKITPTVSFIQKIEYSKALLFSLSIITIFTNVRWGNWKTTIISCIYFIFHHSVYSSNFQHLQFSLLLIILSYLSRKSLISAQAANNINGVIVGGCSFCITAILSYIGTFYSNLIPNVVYDILCLFGIISATDQVFKDFKNSTLSFAKMIPISLMNIVRFNIFSFLTAFPSIPNAHVISTYIIGLICLLRFNVAASSVCSIIFLTIFNSIDYNYVLNTLRAHSNNNKPFYLLVIVGIILAFSKINEMIFISDFGATNMFGTFFAPVIFGILYVWISVFSLLHGILMQKGYIKSLVGLVLLSLLTCNGLLSLNIHSNSFFTMNIILMLLGFASAGEESVLVTLLRNYLPDQKLFGMYFGIFDSMMAVARLLGMTAINLVWFLFGSSIVMSGRFCFFMMLIGLLMLYMVDKYGLKKTMFITLVATLIFLTLLLLIYSIYLFAHPGTPSSLI